MFGTDTMLKHLVSIAHYRDLLADAERQRMAAIAFESRLRPGRPGIIEARAAIAAALIRVGSWLMPQGMPDGCTYPG